MIYFCQIRRRRVSRRVSYGRDQTGFRIPTVDHLLHQLLLFLLLSSIELVTKRIEFIFDLNLFHLQLIHFLYLWTRFPGVFTIWQRRSYPLHHLLIQILPCPCGWRKDSHLSIHWKTLLLIVTLPLMIKVLHDWIISTMIDQFLDVHDLILLDIAALENAIQLVPLRWEFAVHELVWCVSVASSDSGVKAFWWKLRWPESVVITSAGDVERIQLLNVHEFHHGWVRVSSYSALTKFALRVDIQKLVDDIARGHSFWFFVTLLSVGADDWTTIRLRLDVLVRVLECIVDANWSTHASRIQVWWKVTRLFWRHIIECPTSDVPVAPRIFLTHHLYPFGRLLPSYTQILQYIDGVLLLLRHHFKSIISLAYMAWF